MNLPVIDGSMVLVDRYDLVALACKGLHVSTNFSQATYAEELARMKGSSQARPAMGPLGGYACDMVTFCDSLLKVVHQRVQHHCAESVSRRIDHAHDSSVQRRSDPRGPHLLRA